MDLTTDLCYVGKFYGNKLNIYLFFKGLGFDQNKTCAPSKRKEKNEQFMR